MKATVISRFLGGPRFVPAESYREDIDGLRAIAVAGAILFHCGVLPRGYLGVDVFFVISGFLITGIIFRESRSGRFSIARFYTRRLRRILPLTVTVSAVALLVGCVCMLPDDLENLAQSVIATNLGANNVLQAMTTRNYWDVVNEYKPLMHTWSLGVEEQYYLLYPFLFLLLQGRRIRYALPVISILAVLSLVLSMREPDGYRRFYFLEYRLFEIAIGGIVAILLDGRTVQHSLAPLPLAALVLTMMLPATTFSGSTLLLCQVVATCGVLASANSRNGVTAWVLQNPVVTYIGRISFSLYMWHQVVLAFARYACWENLGYLQCGVLLGVIGCLSAVTFHTIEQPFRDAKALSLRAVLACLLPVYFGTMGAAAYVYARAGVIRDVPELGIVADDAVRNMHAAYNERIYRYDRDFPANHNRIRVLVIGDSFARDWANVLLESRFGAFIELSYVYHSQLGSDDSQAARAVVGGRAKLADVIFVSRGSPEVLNALGLDGSDVWVVGPKSFGRSNGVHYNRQARSGLAARAQVPGEVRSENEELRRSSAPRFVDLIEPLSNGDQRVPVFTPSGRFISQDTRHLTRDGACFYGGVLDPLLDEVFASSVARLRESGSGSDRPKR